MNHLSFTGILLVFASAQVAGATAREVQKEFGFDDSKWQLLSESDASIQWASDTGLAITLNVISGKDVDFPSPEGRVRLRDVYRQEALSYGGGLVEAEPRTMGEIYYNLVTMKFPIGIFQTPPDSRPGFGYQINAVFPTIEGRYVLQVAAVEAGMTGIREATGIVIFMKQEGISDLAAAAKVFRRDPYDHAYDARALFNVCDERRFDDSFPNHPLSRCRAEMDRLLSSLAVSERMESIAQFRQKRRAEPGATDNPEDAQ